ncbi:MAG: PEP-CTERM sorting domain-containing protein [Desulfobaccales bacterium]
MRRINIKICATLLGISLLLGLAWVNCAQATLIAYDVAAQDGNQYSTGSLGMDFDVNSPIKITALGVFDSGADGLVGTLYATIYDRDTGTRVVAAIAFTPSDPGNLIGGSRFKNLESEVQLGVGHYSIVSWGYGPDNNGNSTYTPPITLATLNDGGGAISFVDHGRWDVNAGVYPTDTGPVDSDYPANLFLAGTFAYDTSVDPVPVPATVLLLGSGLLGLGLLRRWAWHRKQ